MRVLVYEYLTALDPRGKDPMTCEGRAMRDAVAADFAEFADVEFAPPAESGRFDWSLVIAPETGGLLESAVRTVHAAGGRALNCTPESIRLCGDKLQLFHHWNGAGIRTPFTAVLSDARVRFPAVVKPRFGCGSAATTLVHSARDLAGAERDGETIVQEFVPGRACSLAFLCGPGWKVPLVPSTQELSDDGRFRYRGGVVPMAPDLAARAVAAATRAVECVPGLFGFVGVDLVLGDAGDYCIEINPRLSTSYVGLRALAETNLAAAMVAAAKPVVGWRPGTARFTSSGEVTRETASPPRGA